MPRSNNIPSEDQGRVSLGETVDGFIRRQSKLARRFGGRVARYIFRTLTYYPIQVLFRATPINPNTIVFMTYQGGYSCNPRAIADEFLRQGLPYNLIWVTKGKVDETQCPAAIKRVARGSYEAYRAIASARVIIDNAHNFHRLGLRKKSGQLLLQTWHGSLGIKRLDGDVVMDSVWRRLAQASQQDTDYCISNSQFETDVFGSSYWEGVPVLPYGHARNDIFFGSKTDAAEIRRRVFEKLQISPEKKICLYAPTHRDGQDEGLFALDFERIRNALEARFGGEWVIALRFHARLINISRAWADALPDYVVDATMYPDIQDIMIAAEVGLTDYSSWIFDFVLTGRPGFIIADDLDTFSQSRSFYYPLEATPFAVAETNEQLVHNIVAFDEGDYNNKVHEFLDRLGCIEDGKASERIVLKVHEILSSDR